MIQPKWATPECWSNDAVAIATQQITGETSSTVVDANFLQIKISYIDPHVGSLK